MPPRRVIGIDAGGTKLLGGVVDDQLVVHHRVRRTWRGADRAETLEIFVGAVEEIRAAAPDVEAVGFGIPALVDHVRGVSVWSNHLPIDDVPFRDLMSERLGLPVRVDNDTNAAILAEHRRGAARGAAHAVMLALGTGIGGGLIVNGALHRGARGFAGELGHTVIDLHGEDCPGGCPGRGCFETVVSGRAIGVAATRLGREQPESTLGELVAAGRQVGGGLVTELAHDGDEQARAVLAGVGRRLGIGIAGIVNALDPEIVVIGGGAVAAGDLLLDPARDVLAERALPPGGEPPPIVPAHFGDESGMLGAALLALDEGGVGLIVCPTPIGNLEDVTLRVLSALREADVVACEDTRRTRTLLDRYGVNATLVSYHEHNEQQRAAELVERMRDGATVALVSDAGMPLVSDPGYVLVRACVAAGLSVEVLPGPSAALAALVASALPADRWRFAGFLPRKAGELERPLSEPGGTLVAFESPRRVPATLGLLAGIDPDRQVAVCRELTKVHEEVVRGSAAELAARYSDAPPRGEVVLVLGPPSEKDDDGPPPGLEHVRKLVDAGAKPRVAAQVAAELTGGSVNRLYAALTD